MSDNLFTRIRSAMPGPERVFLRTPDDRTISYGEVTEVSGRMANVLLEIGVAPGDRVAVQVGKSPEALLLYLACLRAGAVYLPLNTGYTGAELNYFLSDAEPVLFVCSPDRRDDAGAVCRDAGVPNIESLGVEGDGTFPARIAKAAPDFTDVDRASDDLAAILYTSGTTGLSKGAMLSHGNLASNAGTLVGLWRFTDADVLLHALPIFHTHGLFVATNVALLSGASMIWLPGLDLDAMIRLMPGASVMMGVPTFYIRLLTRPDFTREVTANIRLFISGSAPLSAETHREFRERTGQAILERYGMTETNMITSNPHDGERRAGAVGFALPGVEVRIADRETGAVLADGEIGQIEVRGPNVFQGYWRMPEKTREEFRDDGFFITGDLGVVGEGGYISIVGRDKDLIISGGYNVYPAEVENAVDAIEGIAESAIIGLPHRDFGEGVTAVVTRSGESDLTGQEIRELLAGELARYKIPKQVIFVDSLPRNAMGKIEKKALRERYNDLYDAGPETTP